MEIYAVFRSCRIGSSNPSGIARATMIWPRLMIRAQSIASASSISALSAATHSIDILEFVLVTGQSWTKLKALRCKSNSIGRSTAFMGPQYHAIT